VIYKALKLAEENLTKQRGKGEGSPMLLYYAPVSIDVIPVDGVIGAELFPDIRGTLEIPELLKEINEADGIGGIGEDAGEDETTAFHLIDDELGVSPGDFRVPDCIPQGAGFKVKPAASARDAIAIPGPSLADSIGLFCFFRANCGKTPARFLIFESDVISMPVRTVKDGERKHHNKPQIKKTAGGVLYVRYVSLRKSK
jgi:hypothetical protein